MADVMAAFLSGHQAAQAEKQHEQALEENKLRTMVLKHQMDGIKIENELRARSLAKENLDLLHGQPEADIPSDQVTTATPNLPSKSLAGVVQGLFGGHSQNMPDATAAPEATTPSSALVPEAQAAQPDTHPVTSRVVRPVNIPGVPSLGVEGVSVRPQTLEAGVAARQRAELEKALYGKYAPGEVSPALGPTPPAGAKLTPVPAGGLADTSTGKVVVPGSGPTSEFGQYQQIYAEGLGKKTFTELTPQEKAGVIPAYNKSKQDPAMHALLIATRQAALTAAQGKNTTAGNFETTGDEFLKTIPIEWRKTVEKIARYDEDPTKVASMRGNMREKLMQWVNQVNPAYDQSQFANRTPTRKAYTTGTQGQQIAAINTAIGHLDQLAPIVAKLDNSSFTPGNAALNKLRTIFGSSKVTNFDTLKDALAGEVASVLSKGAATVSGIAAEKEKIHAASSPEQLADYVKTQIPIMGSKLAGLDYAFHQAMGEDDTFSALSPSSKKILAKFGFDPAEHGAAAAAEIGKGAAKDLPQTKLDNGQIQVTDPTGGLHLFATQAAADRFKAAVKAAGGKP